MNEFDAKVAIIKWATKWKGKIALGIILRADEMANDPSLMSVLRKWYECHTMREEHQARVVEAVSRYGLEFFGDSLEKAVEEYDDKYWGDKEALFNEAVFTIMKDAYHIEW